MKERQKRLIEVYEHLRRYFGIHTKTGFAESLQYGRTSMSAAMNGDEKYLTDSLFKNICDAYPGVFNLDYLLTGEGNLISPEEDAKVETIRMEREQPIDQSSLVNTALAAKDETIKAKEELISALRDTIDSLKRENIQLRQEVSKYQSEDLLDNHPFPIGVAEPADKKKSVRV